MGKEVQTRDEWQQTDATRLILSTNQRKHATRLIRNM
jgi:hypothetical protein